MLTAYSLPQPNSHLPRSNPFVLAAFGAQKFNRSPPPHPAVIRYFEGVRTLKRGSDLPYSRPPIPHSRPPIPHTFTPHPRRRPKLKSLFPLGQHFFSRCRKKC